MSPDFPTTAYSRTATYNAKSEVTADTTVVRQSGGGNITNNSTYSYGLETSAGSGIFTGTYQGGVVTHIASNPSTGPSTSTTTTYAWWDDARQSVMTYKPTSSLTYTSTFTYDANGHMSNVHIVDGRPRRVYYNTDANGQIKSRVEALDNGSAGPTEIYYYFNGLQFGDTGNDGPSELDYASVISSRNAAAQTTAFKAGHMVGYADFDENFARINPNSDRQAGSTYTVVDGDTLTSIAAAIWGDSSLWYLIADANGIDLTTELMAGMPLTIPAKVSNVHNNSDTYRPYDPNKALGEVSPTAPKPPPRAGGCGVVGAIITTIIAFAVSRLLDMVLPGAGSIVGKMINAALSEAVAQEAAVAVGIQDHFSWNQVGIAALTVGVGEGLDELGVFDKIDTFVGNALPKTVSPVVRDFVRGAAKGSLTNATTQGLSLAAGLQRKFSWNSVAAAGMSRGVSEAVTGYLDRKLGLEIKKEHEAGTLKESPEAMWQSGKLRNIIFGGMAGSLAGATARSVMNGGDFGDNILAVLPDMLYSTISAFADDQAARQAEADEAPALSKTQANHSIRWEADHPDREGTGVIFNHDLMTRPHFTIGAGGQLVPEAAPPILPWAQATTQPVVPSVGNTNHYHDGLNALLGTGWSDPGLQVTSLAVNGGDAIALKADVMQLPPTIRAELDASGVTWVAVQDSYAQYDANPPGGAHPGGHPSSESWSNTSGGMDPSNLVVVVATSGLYPSGSVNTAWHETGHAYDQVMGFLSQQPAFVAAWNADYTALDNYDPVNHYYTANTSGPAAGRSEAFAEAFAMYYRGDPYMQAHFPHLYQYFRDRDT